MATNLAIDPRWKRYGTCSPAMTSSSPPALIARLAIRHEASLLTTDQDFVHAAGRIDLRLWPR